MDSRFRQAQRSYYADSSQESAQQYISLLERLCGVGPLPELVVNEPKLASIMQQPQDNSAELEAIRQEQICERFKELEQTLLRAMHRHRPDAQVEDHLYYSSNIRYTWLGGEPPYRYKITRSRRDHRSLHPGELEEIKTLLSVGAREVDERPGYYYRPSADDTVNRYFTYVPSLRYYALSGLPGGEEALITINLETEKEFLVSLLQEMLT